MSALRCERPGHTERALRELWPQARRRLWRPRGWWRWLRLRSRYELRELGLRDVRRLMPLGVVPDCDACEEVCCAGRTRVVPLRLVDIAALIDAGLERCITHQRPSFSIEELERSPALAQLVTSDFWSWFPVLAQDQTGTCTLLGEDLRCRAHPAWPLSCARYPYSLNFGARAVFYAASCPSRTILPTEAAGPRVHALMEATLEAFNQQIRDVVLVSVARGELERLGLLRFLRLPPEFT